jgi:hypothetical protein
MLDARKSPQTIKGLFKYLKRDFGTTMRQNMRARTICRKRQKRGSPSQIFLPKRKLD